MRVRELVTQAMQDIGVIDAQEVPTGADIILALRLFNDTMAQWSISVDLAGSHVWRSDYDLDDPIDLPDYYNSALRCNVCELIAPRFGVAVPADIAKQRVTAIKEIQRHNYTPPKLKGDLTLNLIGRHGTCGLYGNAGISDICPL